MTTNPNRFVTCSYDYCNKKGNPESGGLLSMTLQKKLGLSKAPWYHSDCCCAMHKYELRYSNETSVRDAMKDVPIMPAWMFDETFDSLYNKEKSNHTNK